MPKSVSSFVITLLLLVSTIAVGQIKLQPHAYNYGIDNGLGCNTVYDIITDKQGYLWFATDDGVVKYDGNNFKRFTTSSGLLSKSCFRLVADNQNRIWALGFVKNTIYIANDSVHKPAFLEKAKNSSFASNLLISLVAEADTVWFGLYKQRSMEEGHYVAYDTILKATSFPHMEYSTNSAMRWKNGVTFGHDVKLKPSAAARDSISYAFGLKQMSTQVHKDFGLKHEASMDFVKIHDGYAWSFGDHVIKLDSSGNVTDTYQTTALGTIAIYEDIHQNLWVGTLQRGVICFKGGDFSKVVRYFDGVSITGIVNDINNGYWFSSLDKGVFHIQSLQSFDTKSGTNLCALDEVGSDIWIGTINGAVYQFNENQNTLDSIANIGCHIYWMEKRAQPWIYGTDVTYRLANNELKLEQGTSIRSIHRINNQRYHILPRSYQYYLDDKLSFQSYHHANIIPFDEVIVGDKIFVGGGHGLLKIKKDKFEKITLGIFESEVRSLAYYKDQLHIGTSTKGLLSYNAEDQSLRRLNASTHIGSKVMDLLADEEVLYITNGNQVFVMNDSQENVQEIGTTTSGITKLTRHKEKIFYLTDYGFSILDSAYDATNFNFRIENFHVNGQATNNEIIALEYNNYDVKIELKCIEYNEHISPEIVYKINQGKWIGAGNGEVNLSLLSDGQYDLTFAIKTKIGISEDSLIRRRIEIDKPYYKQFWFIGMVFFTVCGLIWLLILQYYNIQIKKKEDRVQRFELENKALRAQINPHFIFNTLGTIQNLILQKEGSKAIQYLLKFSTLFRMTLSGSRQSVISLYDELETTRTYLELEQERFDDQFTFTIETDIFDAGDIRIPALLIQPFAENCVKHAISDINYTGLITIVCTEYDDYFEVSITDNGVGRKAAGEKRKRHSHDSVGITICQERIDLFNDYKYEGIKYIDLYENGIATGTQVILKLKKDD